MSWSKTLKSQRRDEPKGGKEGKNTQDGKDKDPSSPLFRHPHLQRKSIRSDHCAQFVRLQTHKHKHRGWHIPGTFKVIPVPFGSRLPLWFEQSLASLPLRCCLYPRLGLSRFGQRAVSLPPTGLPSSWIKVHFRKHRSFLCVGLLAVLLLRPWCSSTCCLAGPYYILEKNY